jgi:hypothetical protein
MFDCTTVTADVPDSDTWRSDAASLWYEIARQQYLNAREPQSGMPKLADVSADFPERLGEVDCQGRRYRLARVAETSTGHLIRAYMLHNP